MKCTAKIGAGFALGLVIIVAIGASAYVPDRTTAVWMPIALLVLTIAAVVLMRTARFGGPAAPPTNPEKRRGRMVIYYASAVVAVAVAVMLRWRLVDSYGPLPTFVTFYPAVLLVASIGGGGPGILATVLSALAAEYWFLPPYNSFRVEAPNDVLALGIFTGTCLCLSVLAERLRWTRWAEAIRIAQEQQLAELSRLNEDLSQQSEELSQQSEELAQQNEELQTQSEEIQTLNAELTHREDMLQKLLDAAHLSSPEQAVMQDVCAAAKEMFGPAASTVMVFEQQGDRLMVRAQAGLGPEGAKLESLPAGRCFADLVIAENKTAALADVSLRPDLTLIHPPGEEPFRAILAAPMRAEGRPFGVVGIYSRQKQEWTAEQFRLAEWLAAQCAHILETLRLQHALARERANLRSVFDVVNVGMLVIGEDGDVKQVNNTISRWVRRDVLAWDGGQPGDFMRCVHALAERSGCGHSPRCPACPIRSAFAAVLQTGQPVHDVEAETICRVDGGEVPLWLEISADPLILDGKQHVILAMNNITDRKRAEEALQRTADDLARSNKDLEQFAYVASHDLREPLRMVTGFMGLLKDRCQGKLDAKADEYIFFASDAATRMQGLIDDLLAYSRAGQGEMTERTDVRAVLDSVLRTLTVGIEESAAVITHDPLPTITSNPVELTQVFQNLIGNAITFKGQRKPEIHVGAQRQPGGWLFTVRDNGIGIDPQFADRIFMIFQRLHTREQYPGTGIGLAICKKVVERHGGRIWVESQPGKGSTFCFTIPDQAKEQG